jgi:hypothetical protein
MLHRQPNLSASCSAGGSVANPTSSPSPVAPSCSSSLGCSSDASPSGWSVGQRRGDGDLKASTLDVVQNEMADEGLRIAAPEILYRYGKVFLAAFLSGLDDPSFERALATLT